MTSYTFHPDIGGVTSFNTDVCTELAQRGHAVTLACLTPGETGPYPFPVVRRPRPRQLLRLGQEADVILFSNLSLQLALPLMLLRRPMALFHHSEAAWISPRNAALQVVERLVLKRMTAHFPTSRYTGRASGLPHTVIYPPFDAALHKQVEQWPASERRDVLFVGRLVPEKGLLFLVTHQDFIRRTLGCERIAIAGDGEMRPWLESVARDEPGLVYLGKLSRPDVVREMGRAAYVIVPSTGNEPFGIVALEALAAGSVLVSTNRGGLPEAAGALGHLYDPDDPADFVRALSEARIQREALLTSDAAETTYQMALAQHLKAFSAHTIGQTLEQQLHRLIRAPPRG